MSDGRRGDRVGSKAEMLREQKISDDELKEMFKGIDQDNSGFIDDLELQNALRLYGIQFSVASAQKLMKSIDQSGKGEISFPAFKEFFGRVENPDDLKMLMSAETRKFFDYKQMVDGDPAFAKTFIIPPMVSASEQFKGHADTVESVAWLSDTEFLSASTDGEVRKMTIGSGSSGGASMFNINSSLYSMTVTSDCKRALVGHGSKESNFTMWSLEAGATAEPIIVYQGNAAPVYATAHSPDQIASGSKAGGCCVYSPATAAPVISWEAHQGVVLSAAYAGASNRSTMVTASKDGTVKVWDTRGQPTTMRPVATIEEAAAGGAAWKAMWRKDFEVITCGEDYSIKRWDSRKLAEGPLGCYFGHSDIVRTITLSPCQTYLVSGTVGGGVRMWLSDEESLLRGRLDGAQAEYAESKKLEAALIEQFENGELDDAQELKNAKENSVRLEANLADNKEAFMKQQLLGCTQSALGLDGPALPVSSLAWREGADGIARVAVGSHDQTIRVYEVAKADISQRRGS